MELKEPGKGTETEFFFNRSQNRLLHQSFKRYFGMEGYKTQDHDHTKIFKNKPDAKACYKGRVYYASFLSADQIPRYVSMQSGDATSKSDLIEVLRQGFQAIQEAGLSSEIFREDGAFFSEGVIELVFEYCRYYIIHSQKSLYRQEAIDPFACKYISIGEVRYRVFEHKNIFAQKSCRRIYYFKK